MEQHTGVTPESFAGMLAEHGVTRVALFDGVSGWRELHARTTDLPGELRDAIEHGAVEAIALDRALRITLEAGIAQWHFGDEATDEATDEAAGGATPTDRASD